MVSNNRGQKAGRIAAYASFILSGCFIFSPLHRAQNILIALIFALLTGIAIIYLIKPVFNKAVQSRPKTRWIYAILSALAVIISMFTSLMLLTEVIKDVAYVASRGISLFYYIAISFAMLSVSFYLCFNSEKGIYRFCILSFIIFISLSTVILSSFITTKSVIPDFLRISRKSFEGSALCGILSGLYFSCDTCIFLYCFKEYFTLENGKTDTRSLLLGYELSFGIIFIYNITAALIFGSKLIKTLDDPDFALVKLISGTDLTEIISTVRIFSFMIKSSLYLFCAAKALKLCFKKPDTVFLRLVLAEFIMIPTSVAVLCFFDRTLGYGEFQFLIYPAIILLSALFILLYSQLQKTKMNR